MTPIAYPRKEHALGGLWRDLAIAPANVPVSIDTMVLEWYNTTKFIFATNKLPKVGDMDDDAFFRRFDIIEFNEVFVGDNCDETLFDRILVKEGNEALSYIARYDGLYDFMPDKEEVTTKWLSKADVVYKYFEEYHIPTEITDKTEFFAVWRDF